MWQIMWEEAMSLNIAGFIYIAKMEALMPEMLAHAC